MSVPTFVIPTSVRNKVDVYLALKDKGLSLDEIRFVILEMQWAQPVPAVPV